MPNRNKVYLAGPFFNEPQLDLIERLEGMLSREMLDVFSPRKAGICPPDASAETRESVVDKNLVEISRANLVIAVMDYLQPHNQALYLGTPEGFITGPIRVPDAGTVFEMGYACSKRIPVLAFYKEEPKRVNLMLSNTCRWNVVGFLALTKWLKSYRVEEFNVNAMKGIPWQGTVV